MWFNRRVSLNILAVLGMLALIGVFDRLAPALAAPGDPGSIPADAFIINDEYLRSTWPQSHLQRMGIQSPQWKPIPSDRKTYGSNQQFSIHGGSSGLWIYVNAGKAYEKSPRDGASLKENILSFIQTNRYNRDEKLEFINDCSKRGYPLVFHYRSADRGGGLKGYHEGFSGYAKGYFIMFYYKGSHSRAEYFPPPQWLEGVFFKWLEVIPALDDASSAGGVSGKAGPGQLGDDRSFAATAAAGATLTGGLLLHRLLGGTSLPQTGGGSTSGTETRGAGEGEDRGRRQGYRYWISTTAHRRRLKANGKDSVWVYAQVESNDPEADTYSLTRDISFTRSGEYGRLLSVSDVQITGGYAAVQVHASPSVGESVPQGRAQASVTARAAGADGPISGALDLELEMAGVFRLETRTHQDRRSLRPDGRDGIWLYAAVLSDVEDGEGDLPKANDSLSFSPAGEGADWVLLGDPQYTGGWRAVYVQAAKPGAANGSGSTAPAPDRVTVVVTGSVPDGELRAGISFELLPVPTLEADPEKAEFLPGSDHPVDIKVFVINSGGERWDFEAELDHSQVLMADTTVRQEGPASAVVTLTLSGAQAETGLGQAGYRRNTLRITARQNDVELHRDVSALLAVEGLEIEHRTYPDRQFRLAGDGKSTVEIDFAVFRRDGSGELVSDMEAVKGISFEDSSEDNEARNAIRLGELDIAFDRVRRLNTPYGVYTFRLRREVPKDGSVLPARIRAYVPELGDQFSRTFSLGIETTDMGPGSRAWEEELKRTEDFIQRFVPEGYRPNFLKILDSRKHTLGVDGLYRLRRQIWTVAQDLILAQGKSYEAEASWQDYYLEIVNWTKWLGDQAFSIVAGSVLGPGYALATCITRDALVDALGRWSAGQSFDDYVGNRVKEVIQGIGEYAANPDELKKKFGYTRAYGIYFCWRFMYNLGTNNDEGKPRSAVEAAWQAVKECTTTAVDSWLGRICEKEAVARGWKKGADGGPQDDNGGSAGEPAALGGKDNSGQGD